ncbi:hypothetical protein [Flexithrix dorotheae]|uniref:hypothetical protein n=1 Tax=Flexithrix dorotheae TaxID=70993 RepID=UPI00036C5B95|nr:hypothetical protein [Flexithrix dorotheae]
MITSRETHKSILLFIPFITLIINNIYAQKVHTYWPEFNPQSHSFKVITLDEEGALVFEKANSLQSKKKYTYSIIHYNTDFSVNKKYILEMEKSLDYKGTDKTDGHIYFLFASHKKAFMEIIKLDLNQKKLEKTRIETLRGLQGISFKVIKNSLFVKANSRNSSMVFQAGLNQEWVKGIKVIYTLSHKNAQLLALKKQKSGKGIMVSSQITYHHQKRINFKSFNLEGELDLDFDVIGQPYKNLLDGKVVRINNTDLLVIGTFTNLESNLADGFFVSRILDGRQENIKYYDFYKLDHFLKALSQNDQAKFNRVKKKLELQNGNPPTFQYQLYIHDIVEQNGTYSIIGEEFESTFLKEIVDETTGMVAPEAFEYNLDKPSFKISKAIIASFDQQGDLVWENSFVFQNLKSFDLNGVLKFKSEGSLLKVLYKDEGIIHRKILDKGVLLEEANTSFNIQKNAFLGLENWYDNYFFAWGYQQKSSNKKQREKNLCFKKITL